MAKKNIKTQEVENQENTKKEIENKQDIVNIEDVIDTKINIKDTQNEATITNTMTNLSFIELNNMLIAAEHLTNYYTNIIKANEGMYTYDTKDLCTDAREKINLLETKKIDILKQIEKKILTR